jgi:hypothetical protein
VPTPIPSDSPTGSTAAVPTRSPTLVSNTAPTETPTIERATFAGGAVIGGRVFNADTDEGIRLTLVQLLNATDLTVLRQIFTGVSGNYLFDDLSEGNYLVRFPIDYGAGFSLIEPNLGSDSSDSDANVLTGLTETVMLQSSDIILDVDAGIRNVNSVDFIEENIEDSIIECPKPFVPPIDADHPELCILPCPVPAFEDSEYSVMWIVASIIGMIGLVLNLFVALTWVIGGKKAFDNTNFFLRMCVFYAILYGAVRPLACVKKLILAGGRGGRGLFYFDTRFPFLLVPGEYSTSANFEVQTPM